MSLFANLFNRRTPPPDAGWIEADDLSARLTRDRAPVVVDVRGSDEFGGALGHIGGAINVPLPDLAAQIPALLGRAAPLVLVCKTDRRSAAAAAQLRAAGASDVLMLRGGMERWRALGLP